MLSARRFLHGAATLFFVPVLAATVGCGRTTGTQAPAPPAPAPVAQPAPAQAPASAAAPPNTGDPSFLQSLQQVAQSRVNYKFVLDETTREYHWWNCTIAAAKGNAVTPTTMSREQIAAAGYRPCPHCRPDMDAPPTPAVPPANREPQRLGPPPAKELQTPIEVGTAEKPKDAATKAPATPVGGEFPKATTTPTQPPTSGSSTPASTGSATPSRAPAPMPAPRPAGGGQVPGDGPSQGLSHPSRGQVPAGRGTK